MGLYCPQCESQACKRNGYTRHGKQNHRCLDCGRQFSLEPLERFEAFEMEFVAAILTDGNACEASTYI